MKKLFLILALTCSIAFAKSDNKMQYLATWDVETMHLVLHGKTNYDESVNGAVIATFEGNDTVAIIKYTCPNASFEDVKTTFYDRSWKDHRCTLQDAEYTTKEIFFK